MGRESPGGERFDSGRTRREVLRLLGGTAAVAAVGTGTAVAQSGGNGSFTVEDPLKITSWDGTTLVTSLFEPTAAGPHPTMLLTHGFGGTRADVRPLAEMYASHGYVALTYDSRGFGQSEGYVNINGPKEIRDAQQLITYLAGLDSVQNDGPDDPTIGMDGASYGGGIQLLTAAAEGAREGLPESADRLDTIVPRWAWNDLVYSLAPNGVIKKGWATLLLLLGRRGASAYGKGLAPVISRYFETAKRTGEVSPEAVAYFKERSPAYATGLGSLEDITTPALFIQGWPDTLFFPNAAVRNARVLEENGIPAHYIFFEGGHTIPPGVPPQQKSYNDAQALAWVDTHCKTGGTSTSVPTVSYFEPQSDDLRTADAFPPTDAETRTLSLADAADGGDDSSRIPDPTPQPAGPAFDFPIERETEFIGVPKLSVAVEPLGTRPHLYFGFYRVTTEGEEIGPLSGQITPLEVTGEPGSIRTVTLDGVAFQRQLKPGETLRLRVSTVTDIRPSLRPSDGPSGAILYHSDRYPATVTMPARPVGASEQNTLRIEGSGEYTAYTFSTSGNVTLAEEDAEETINDSTAYGAVGPDSDTYNFTGELTDLAVAGSATVYVNSEKVDPSTIDSDMTVVTFKGTGSYGSYSFSASGKVDGGIYLDREDSFSGNHGSGAVIAGQETYFVNGDLTNITTDGDVTVVKS